MMQQMPTVAADKLAWQQNNSSQKNIIWTVVASKHERVKVTE